MRWLCLPAQRRVGFSQISYVGLWIVYGGYQVVDDPSLLALFLSTISIFRGIGGEVGVACFLLLAIVLLSWFFVDGYACRALSASA